ncbi:MAG: hypothetical protein U0271_34360 [Polyangiaceae bacterium]
MMPHTTRRLAVLAIATAMSSSSACSLVIEQRDRQCERDADCASFGDARCDTSAGVCVPQGGAGGGDNCSGPDGCYSCAPVKPVEFLNACTDAQCIPYDNTPLQGLLEPDGSLPPVP